VEVTSWFNPADESAGYKMIDVCGSDFMVQPRR
jgi:hypothetical protein